jgi:four helix bundle protein
MGDFRKLEVWRKSQRLAAEIYALTTRFPVAERYGLSAQMRRAAVSVSANLAEGCGRMGDTELRRFVRISLGSLSELECELLLAGDLQLVNHEVSREMIRAIGSIRGMLHTLHKRLPGSSRSPLSRP